MMAAFFDAFSAQLECSFFLRVQFFRDFTHRL
jgi:hypothetical protein